MASSPEGGKMLNAPDLFDNHPSLYSHGCGRHPSKPSSARERTDERHLDGQAGQAAKNAGMQRILDNNDEWKRLCIIQTEQLRIHRPSDFPSEFRFEELTERLKTHIGEPTRPEAWGALCGVLIRRKLIEKTGRYEPMKVSRSHGRETKVYRFAA